MKQELLQQALDALENHSGNYKLTDVECVVQLAAITALKDTIAQPVQPVTEIAALSKDAGRWRKLVNASEMAFPVLTIADDPENDCILSYGRESLENLVDAFDEISDANIAQPVQPVQPTVPYAYAIYFPDQQREELVHDIDDVCEDMTNDGNHVVTPLYEHPAIAQPALPDAGMDSQKLIRMRSAFMTCTSCGPEKLYELRFAFPSLPDMQAAHHEWLMFTGELK